MRTITLVWMYHNIMDLYGDQGNILVLHQRCAARGINLMVRTCGVGEAMDLREADLLFVGGGADREQGVMYDDLVSRKDNIKAAIDGGTMVLLICGGYQLFGQYYQDGDGKKLAGLGLFDYYTVSDGKTRCIGSLVVEGMIDGQPVTMVGFENHGGMTYGVTKPLGRVLSGHGNHRMDKKANEKNSKTGSVVSYEGYFDGQVLGTYMHGPLLPRNPQLADYLIKGALRHQGLDEDLLELNDELAIKAREVIMKRVGL